MVRHKKFCWTNFDKIWRFLFNQEEFGSNCAVDKHTKVSVEICVSADIQKVPIISMDRYHFLKPIPIFSKKFSSIFVQLSIFDWPIPIFQNLLTDIFADILTKYFD